MISKIFATSIKSALVAAFAVALSTAAFAADDYYDGMSNRNPSLTGEWFDGTAEGEYLRDSDLGANSGTVVTPNVGTPVYPSSGTVVGSTVMPPASTRTVVIPPAGSATTTYGSVNTFGSAVTNAPVSPFDNIDRRLQSTANEANEELDEAFDRDEYNFRRRQLKNTQSLYAPGTSQYEQINQQINQLDSDYNRNPGSFGQPIRNNNTGSASSTMNRPMNLNETANRTMNNLNNSLNNTTQSMNNLNDNMNRTNTGINNTLNNANSSMNSTMNNINNSANNSLNNANNGIQRSMDNFARDRAIVDRDLNALEGVK